jgi:hypothetical protein
MVDMERWSGMSDSSSLSPSQVKGGFSLRSGPEEDPSAKKCQLTDGDQEVVKALGSNPSADQWLSPVLAPTPALGSSLFFD